MVQKTKAGVLKAKQQVDTRTVGRNTTHLSPKLSNSQTLQNGSNKKPAEDKGTDRGGTPSPKTVNYGDISRKMVEKRLKTKCRI
ncbi:hypothetical protein [Lysinibacillus fusiformis]|uniref:hypothetical protein n=1 Tax=Lysinibacillus fusiformis TaxID=28031 RepID=UPI001378DB73|nr:hypothetical protein [Lysinibacillus fusiformis]